MDRPGKDSYRHREAGAHEVLVAAPRAGRCCTRWPGREPGLPDLLARLEPVDLVLVEGFKTHPLPEAGGSPPRARQAADLAGPSPISWRLRCDANTAIGGRICCR